VDGASVTSAGIHARQPVGERWRLEVAAGALGAVVADVERAGGRVLSVQPIRQSLEDYFVQVLGADAAPAAEERGTWALQD
jgi:hypothetical protein